MFLRFSRIHLKVVLSPSTRSSPKGGRSAPSVTRNVASGNPQRGARKINLFSIKNFLNDRIDLLAVARSICTNNPKTTK
jgi:hypothetical protein